MRISRDRSSSGREVPIARGSIVVDGVLTDCCVRFDSHIEDAHNLNKLEEGGKRKESQNQGDSVYQAFDLFVG